MRTKSVTAQRLRLRLLMFWLMIVLADTDYESSKRERERERERERGRINLATREHKRLRTYTLCHDLKLNNNKCFTCVYTYILIIYF